MDFANRARITAACGFFGVSLLLMMVALTPGLGAMPREDAAVLAVASLVIGGLLVSSKTVPSAVRPFTGFIDRIYFGDSWRELPPANLTLGRAYRHEGRLEDALGEYTRLRDSHPGHVEVLAEGILTLRALGDEKTAARWLRKGLRRVRTSEERAKLNEAMTAPAVAPVDRFY